MRCTINAFALFMLMSITMRISAKDDLAILLVKSQPESRQLVLVRTTQSNPNNQTDAEKAEIVRKAKLEGFDVEIPESTTVDIVRLLTVGNDGPSREIWKIFYVLPSPAETVKTRAQFSCKDIALFGTKAAILYEYRSTLILDVVELLEPNSDSVKSKVSLDLTRLLDKSIQSARIFVDRESLLVICEYDVKERELWMLHGEALIQYFPKK